MADVNRNRTSSTGFDPRLFLRDEELDNGIALLLAGERALINLAEPLISLPDMPPLAKRVLIAARFQPGQTVRALGHHLGTTTPTLARILGQLDKGGLIERRATRTDRRSKAVFLSTEGKRLTDEATIVLRNRLREAYRQAGANAVVGKRAVLKALLT
ncbi:MAG: MarR family winged helix-turn-helix transcriptional regulator [Henriciella sp.]